MLITNYVLHLAACKLIQDVRTRVGRFQMRAACCFCEFCFCQFILGISCRLERNFGDEVIVITTSALLAVFKIIGSVAKRQRFLGRRSSPLLEKKIVMQQVLLTCCFSPPATVHNNWAPYLGNLYNHPFKSSWCRLFSLWTMNGVIIATFVC